MASSGLMKLGEVVAATFAIEKIKDFAEESIHLAAEEESVTSRLAVALSHVKGARQEDLEALKAQATQMQNTTTASRDQVETAQAHLATLGLTSAEIQKLIPHMADMAAAHRSAGSAALDLGEATDIVQVAMTRGIVALQRHGIAIDENTKKHFALADAAGKVDIITELLNQRFSGQAVAAAETYQGKLEILHNQFQDTERHIGAAFIPTIEMLSDQLNKSLSSFNGTSSGTETLSKAIYQATNFVIAIGKALELVIEVLVGFGLALVDAGKVVVAFAQDVIANFSNIKDRISTIIDAMSKALKGDFAGAADDMKKSIKISLDNTHSALADFVTNTKGTGAALSDQWGSIGESMSAAIDLKGFKPMSEAAIQAGDTITQGMSGGAAKASDTLQKSLQKLGEEFISLKEKGADALSKLADEHASKMESIRSQIDRTQESINSLNESFNKTQASDTKSVAEEVVKTEQDISDKQKQLATETNEAKRQSLMDEISKEQTALNNSSGFIKSIDGAVTEAKRRAGLTQLERAIEDYNAKRKLAQDEYDDKVAKLQDELKAQQDKQQQEVDLYNAKQSKIQAILDQAQAQYATMLDEQFRVTEEKVTAEIELYQRLAEAIAKVQGGSIGTINNVTPTGNRGSVTNQTNNIHVNVNGTAAATGRQFATQVGNAIMGQLRTNARVPI